MHRLLTVFSLRSLRGRMALLLGMALLPTGLLALNAGIGAVNASHAVAQEEAASAELRDMGARQVDIQRLRTVARTIAANGDLVSRNMRDCSQLLRRLGAEFHELAAVVILDETARIRCAADPGAVGRQSAAGPLIAESARLGDVAAGFVASPVMANGPVLGAVAPMRSGSHLYAGLTRLSGPLLARSKGASGQAGGFAALVDGSGRVLQVNGLETGSARMAALAAAVQHPAKLTTKPFRVGESWAVMVKFLEPDIYIVHGWRPGRLGPAASVYALWTLIAPLLLWLAAVAVAWWALEVYVARPLSTLESLARSYARGEETAAPESFRHAPEEISSLRRTLAAMAKTLRGREKRIAEALQEERALLLEVNHRVKNNLQVVASILSILARSSDNDQQAIGLTRAQDRIQLLALAQNEIHSSGELRDVRLDKLAGDICHALVAARGARAANVTLRTTFESARTSVEYAVPFAFLVGESLLQTLDNLVDGEPAIVDLALKVDRGDDIIFTIEAPDIGAVRVAPPIAHRIIAGFARQIGATVDYDQGRSFVTRIRLRKVLPDMAK